MQSARIANVSAGWRQLIANVTLNAGNCVETPPKSRLGV